ncbi:MFS transporter [Streptomyces sp. NBC_01373]|uniref:MFS transporter n=1 Tax=Streptomyces sp. NBC_01373 TaxID=2903843 RepID=UPI00224CC75C|nr:MFS transporter [Streptomyces sp. NBC_01373]MCX4706564.1 MFS transporter [Streptomyces sp. NBC_01373]
MDLATRRRRRSLFLFFLIPGLSISSWVTRTPDIRDRLHASTGEMGLILFGLSVGSMIGILCSGTLVSRFGTRPVMGLGTSMVVASTLVIGFGSLTTSSVTVTGGLCVMGAGMGAGEVAINVDGADVERLTGTTVLPTLHGFFSLGTVVGAALGMGATAAALPVHWHLGVITLVCVSLCAYALRAVPDGTGRRRKDDAVDEAKAGTRPKVWKDRRLALIGAIVLAMALAEGAANDWLPLLMVDGHGLDATMGSVVYVGFAAAMAIGRFSGGFLLERFSRPAVVRGSAASAAVGLSLVIFSDSPLLAGISVLFWGLGSSLGFPLTLSAAGDSGPESAARVGFAATIGYIAFLVGPPGLGFIGDHYGLRSAMLVVLACVAASFFIAPAVRRPATRPLMVAAVISADEAQQTGKGTEDVSP